jgi:3-deoxy-D-manno-octulosonate 8-phosphate phosphatase (KDO 8-P phosphatase)
MNDKILSIKMLLMDVDGVLSDGSVVLGNDDLEIKIFDSQDGMGLDLAKRGGLLTGLITGRISYGVARRARELKIDEVAQGSYNKLEPYEAIKTKYHLADNEIAYIGDDLLDLGILKRCGFRVAVANAVEEVKKNCDYTTYRTGGKGAVREVIELILKNQGKWRSVLEGLPQ